MKVRAARRKHEWRSNCLRRTERLNDTMAHMVFNGWKRKAAVTSEVIRDTPVIQPNRPAVYASKPKVAAAA